MENKQQIIVTKRISIIVLLMLFSSVSFSQHIGYKGGLTLSKMQINSESINGNSGAKAGFIGGLVAEFPIKKSIILDTSLNIKSLGASIQNNLANEHWQIYYLDFDVLCGYEYKLKHIELFAEGGMYMAYGLNGVKKSGGEPSLYMALDSGNEKDLKPFDFGLVFSAGTYYKRWKLSIQYQPGMLNLSNVSNESIKNRVGIITLTYLFTKPLTKNVLNE